MKRIIGLFSALIVFCFLSLNTGNELQAQISAGFSPVATDCFTPQTDDEDPLDVGDASNCVLGGLGCADSQCGAGTIEVQRPSIKEP